MKIKPILPLVAILVGLVGMAWLGIGVSAPTSHQAGSDMTVSATSTSSGLRIVVYDDTGTKVYDSDNDPNAVETKDSDGNWRMSCTVSVPNGSTGVWETEATNTNGDSASASTDIT